MYKSTSQQWFFFTSEKRCAAHGCKYIHKHVPPTPHLLASYLARPSSMLSFAFPNLSRQKEFRPNLSPKQIIRMGSFGGTYFRPIKSSVTGKSYRDVWKEFPDGERTEFPSIIVMVCKTSCI